MKNLIIGTLVVVGLSLTVLSLETIKQSEMDRYAALKNQTNSPSTLLIAEI